MSGYPIVLTGLERSRCIVIGGGAVAARKAQSLADAGARPVVISPELGPELEEMAALGRVEAIRRAYRPGDLARAMLVIAATDDRAVNAAVSAEAEHCGALVNVVDDPELCTFHVPAVVRRGEVVVTASTGGGSPALARHLREVLEVAIDPAYGDLLTILTELRPRVRSEFARAKQALVWQRLLDGEVLACLRDWGLEAARDRAERILTDLATM